MSAAEEVYNIYYDNEINAVVMEWDGYATSRQFKEGTELMLDTLVKNNTFKVLADIKDMTLIGMDDQHWLENNFIPRAAQSGFRALAIIRPDSYFNKVAVESVSYKVDTNMLRINFFDSAASAREWLAGL